MLIKQGATLPDGFKKQTKTNNGGKENKRKRKKHKNYNKKQ